MRDRAFDAGQLFVVAPALVGVGLGQGREAGGSVPGAFAGTAKRVSVATNSAIGIDGLEESSLNGLPVVDLRRVEPVERPVSTLDCVFLVTHRLRHVDPVGDARAVGDHE